MPQLTPHNTSMTVHSATRVARFVDSFIRSEFCSNIAAQRANDYTARGDRAARCYDAAEHGSDGSTHSEHIDDMREAFSQFLDTRDWHKSLDRVSAAFNAHCDALDAWHDTNGTLHSEIG